MRSLVCIGFAEALAAPEVSWSLRDAGHEIIAFGRRGSRSALRHSRTATVIDVTPPEADYLRTVQELQAIVAGCDRIKYPNRAFLPLDDTSVFLSSRLKLDGGWRLAGPTEDGVKVALDKTVQTTLAREAGFHVPQTTEATKTSEVLDRAIELPLILRPSKSVLPINGRLHKGKNWICGNEGELRNALTQWKEAYPLLVQPFIRGGGEGVFGLATDAGVKAWTGHRRLRMMNPHGSGSSACVSQGVQPDVQERAEEFIRLAQWRGLFMIELLRDTANRIWFVEFNGRSWGSIALSRRLGFEYPAWAVNLALYQDARIDMPAPRLAPVRCRNVGREFLHFLFVLRGPKSKAMNDWPSFWRTCRELFHLRRGDCVYNWRRDDRRVFLSDFWCTVRNNLLKKPR
jgi:hypothetical protein